LSFALDEGAILSEDNTERNRAIILSDAVLTSVLKQSSELGFSDIGSIRNSLYVQGTAHGTMMNIIVLTDNQELSDKLCKLVEASACENFNNLGVKSTVIQTATSYGPAKVEKRQRSDNFEKSDIILSQVAGPTAISIVVVCKWLFKGGCLFIFLAYCLVCARYILRGRLIYANELIDAGITVIGVIKKDTKLDSLIRKIEMLSQENSLVIADYGNSCDTEKIAEQLKEKGKDVITGSDILDAYLAPQGKYKEIILLVERDKITIRNLLNAINIYEKYYSKVIGVIFVE